MSHDEAQTDQLAPPHLFGLTIAQLSGAAPVCRVRRAVSLGQAVATGRRAWQAARSAWLTYAAMTVPPQVGLDCIPLLENPCLSQDASVGGALHDKIHVVRDSGFIGGSDWGCRCATGQPACAG